MPTTITSGQVIAVLLVVAAFKLGEGFFAPLVVAVLASVALSPPVWWLTRVLPRAAASAVVVVAIAGGVGLTAFALSDEAVAFSKELPTIVRKVRSAIRSASPRAGVVQQLQQAVAELERTTAAPSNGAAKVTIVKPVDVQWGIVIGTRRAAELLGQLVLMLFFVYFLLASGDLFKSKLVTLGGDGLSQKKVTLRMLDEIIAKIGQFVFYQAWSGVLVGVLTWLAFLLLDVRYAGLWGVAAGVLNCVPYFGPTVVLVASSVAALIQFQSVPKMAVVAGVSLAITSLEGMLLAPLALGRAARVNTVATFVALMFWGWLWGAVGLVVAVPILMILKTIADHVQSLSAWSDLLADRK
jgi:predicted PurR-regulated permease PerM